MSSPIRKKPLSPPEQQQPDHKGKGKEKAKLSAFDTLPREIIQEYVVCVLPFSLKITSYDLIRSKQNPLRK